MTTLETKLREATGPSRELDGLVWAEVLPAIEPLIPHWSREQRESLFPPYTSSVDAALTLIPAEWHVWSLGETADGWRCALFNERMGGPSSDYHPTAPLAICLAAILVRKDVKC